MGGTGTCVGGQRVPSPRMQSELGVILRGVVRSLDACYFSARPEQKNVSRQRHLQATISQVGLQDKREDDNEPFTRG